MAVKADSAYCEFGPFSGLFYGLLYELFYGVYGRMSYMRYSTAYIELLLVRRRALMVY